MYSKPEWAHAVNLSLLVISGLLLAIALPRLSPITQLLTSSSLLASIYIADYWLWVNKQFAIDTVVPLLNIVVIGIFNMAYGFVISARDKTYLKSVFGQYIPPELVEQMSIKQGKFILQKIFSFFIICIIKKIITFLTNF